MVTYARGPRFNQDQKRLTREQLARFMEVVYSEFVVDLKDHGSQGFRPRLRVKRVVSTRGVWEMTWAPDGRATFEYGEEIRTGEPHIIWRRVGTHDILRDPR